MKREPVELDDRKGMTDARKRRVFARTGERCKWPGCEETKGLEIDHIICLGLGGKDADHNLEPLCNPHHKIKTARDKALIAKAKRLVRKDDPEARKPPSLKSANRWPVKGSVKIQSRPFSKRRDDDNRS